MRRLASVIAVALAAATLTACSTVVNEAVDNSGCGAFRSGASSEAVVATGKGDTKAPKVSFPTPLHSTGSQVSVLRTGTGTTVNTGDVAKVGVTLLVGRNGQTLETVGYDAGSVLTRKADSQNTLDAALACRTVGTRFALTTSAKAAFGAGALAQAGVKDSATLVLVVDVQGRYLGKADGANQLQDNSLPAVVTAVDGTPGIVFPNTGAPKKAASSVVKAGSGAKLSKGDHAVVQYSQFAWDPTSTSKAAVATTWDKPAPVIVDAGTGSADTPFGAKLTGQRVGSQIIYVFPPASSGAADAAATIWVVDVLGIAK